MIRDALDADEFGEVVLGLRPSSHFGNQTLAVRPVKVREFVGIPSSYLAEAAHVFSDSAESAPRIGRNDLSKV